MRFYPPNFGALVAMLAVSVACGTARADESAEPAAKTPPNVGETAEMFTLQSLNGEKVELKKLLKEGPVVVAVLRGYPGYQCPACTRQVGGYVMLADDFAKAKATVVFVYPGEAKELEKRAQEFLKQTELPAPLTLVLDPDHKFVTAAGLRWEAPNETAYPSTFIVDGEGKVTFRKISKSHGDRAEAADVLKALQK
ncbi:peroxiredoxin family protein [Lacipirellula limnantheis]|uniref:thioredoxin-dependent peroxiredoxin n=1 Tax=Lacipirellula limnantheis TaxID=2528024 RepID=A0A517TWY4_9BACT|nr:peroxiredoxin family protein [Lacipirellula limnantheis]QDT72884.1 thiol-disulfide oxidoreductase [Lacipirellula limnantheis]